LFINNQKQLKMNYILFDDENRDNLLPLTYTRPVCELRCGILTLKEKWEKRLSGVYSFQTKDYLSEKYPIKIDDVNIYINGSLIANNQIVLAIENLNNNEILKNGEKILAAKVTQDHIAQFDDKKQEHFKIVNYSEELHFIEFPWDIFKKNEQEIASDFEMITQNRKSAKISDTNRYIHPERIFIEEGADVEFSILNPTDGYIYVGKNASIMENSTIHGSLALCDNAVVKIGAKIYGASTIGPYSKVGGELSNSVIIGYSNKGHDGFLGNSVLGEWCNLGADTNNSNLKNNYAEVRLWNYPEKKFVSTGLQFCGLIMGDHSKSGINTMFNTGTIVGVSSNIFGTGFPRNFIPSFSWGGSSGFTVFKPQKAYEVAEKVMQRRQIEFTEKDKKILDYIFKISAEYRR